MGKIKPWEELSFQDDYMFKRVMSHKRFCKRMISFRKSIRKSVISSHKNRSG